MTSTTYNGFINYQSVAPRWHTIYEGSDTDTTGPNYRDSRITYSGLSYLCTPYIPSSTEINLKLRITIKYQTNWLPEYTPTSINYYNNNVTYAVNKDVNTVTVTLDNMQYFDAVTLLTIHGRVDEGHSTGFIEIKWNRPPNVDIKLDSNYNSTAVENNIYALAWITKIEQYY